MKQYLILILTAIFMAFLTGYMALSLKGNYTASEEDIAEIHKIKGAFRKFVPSKTVINFSSIYYREGQFSLVNPIYAFKDTRLNNEVQYFTSEGCFKELKNLINKVNYEKIWIWEEFRCGQRAYLPDHFFTEAPYMHPSGYSYTYLFFLLSHSKKLQKRRKWAINHLPYFHIKELKDLEKSVGGFEGIFSILAKLREDSLDAFSKGKKTIFDKEHLFLRTSFPLFFNVLEYNVYDSSHLDKFLDQTPYDINIFKKGKGCLYREGNLCWTYSVAHTFGLLNKSIIVLLIALIFFIIITVRIIMMRLRTQKLEDEKRRLALRVLTHEFRTPVTSLLLIIERLNNHLAKLEESDQDEILRISREVYRLQRLTETSRHYLMTKQNGGLIDVKMDEVENLRYFIEDVLDSQMRENPEEITIESVSENGPWFFDRYWIGICLKNLVDNALMHGGPPIKIRLKEREVKDGHQLHLSVEDSGEVLFNSIEEMTDEFSKGNKSQGTGLGLNIVYKVIKEMGGSLTLEKSPTVMIAIFPVKKINEEVRSK